jgi:hypothetical protein
MEKQLPETVKEVCSAFVERLENILGSKLYGAYMYGAAVFPDAGPVQDIDCHVILRDRLADVERDELQRLKKELARRFPTLGSELDAYFILLEQAKGASRPQHQLNVTIFDDSWALHCAHIRAGYYVCLYGPEPAEIFPEPSWSEIAAALDHELKYIEENLHHQAYCILNLCRIMYSHIEKNPVVSKHFSGVWASSRFPEWKPLIDAAMRFYKKKSHPEDKMFMSERTGKFLAFARERIHEVRGGPAT